MLAGGLVDRRVQQLEIAMKRIDWFCVAVAIYGIGVIGCFGPATVESERAMNEHAATCTPRPSCEYFGPSISDGIFKAMFWPMWLSYQAAKVPNA